MGRKTKERKEKKIETIHHDTSYTTTLNILGRGEDQKNPKLSLKGDPTLVGPTLVGKGETVYP